MIVRSGRGYEVPNYDSEEYKEELLSKLKDYKGIIANSLYDYLNSLLGLEISDFSNEISDKQRALLTRVDFELYRYISIYNILCRIQKLFVEDKNKLQIDSDSFSKKLKIFIPIK